jgi:hypothetical protein
MGYHTAVKAVSADHAKLVKEASSHSAAIKMSKSLAKQGTSANAHTSQKHLYTIVVNDGVPISLQALDGV